MSEQVSPHELPAELPLEQQGGLFNADQVEDGSYHLLTGHYRSDGSYKSDEQLRSEYMELTDKLVHKMTHGIEVENPDTGERELREPDVVIWLDKSARPLSWLTKATWDQLAPEADGTVPKMPDFKFVNIDREQWVNQVDPLGTGYMNIEHVDPSIIRSLRSIFVSVKDKKDGLTEAIDDAKSSLDGKTIMIVDEVNASGRTLDIAQKFFKRAFPDAAIGATHWMGGIANKGQATGNRDLPVWYREDTEYGRGVGNRDERKSQGSHSQTQRLGGWFLSTALAGDENAQQLRKELKMLAQDAADHKVIFKPSSERDIDDIEERVSRYNNMSVEEFVAHKKAQK